MIAPGALVTCRQTGLVLYVVKAPAPGGGHWYLQGKRVDERGRSDCFSRVSGAGDIVTIREAPTYSPGEMIVHDGVYHEVAADNGDEVVLIVPAGRNPLDGGGAVRMPAGDHVTVAKSDIVMEMMK